MIQLITRRVLRRTHLLRPDVRFNQLALYLLAVFARRYHIELHAVVFMSSHLHLLVTDTYGCIPDFLRDFHRALALGTKVLRRWQGALWDDHPTSRVQLCTPQAIIEKLAYIMANPVHAGLVHRAEDWPGVTTLPQDLGTRTWTVQRPDFYFDPDNLQWPTTATLRLTLPRTPWAQQELRARVQQELERLESQAHRQVRANGWRVLGRGGVLRSSPYQQTTSWEPQGELNPSVAVGRGQQDLLQQAVQVLRSFRRAYRSALEKWRAGQRKVVFPAYTWQMHWLHRVQVAPS